MFEVTAPIWGNAARTFDSAVPASVLTRIPCLVVLRALSYRQMAALSLCDSGNCELRHIDKATGEVTHMAGNGTRKKTAALLNAADSASEATMDLGSALSTLIQLQ